MLGAMAGVVGSIQALEALKLLTGVGEPLTDRILQIDGLTWRADACRARAAARTARRVPR